MKIVDSWLNDLPQQFLEKKNIEALIPAFSKQLQEIEDVFDNLKNLTDLDTAAGQNLDMVGTIIPLSRKEADRKSTRLNSSHSGQSRMPSSA